MKYRKNHLQRNKAVLKPSYLQKEETKVEK